MTSTQTLVLNAIAADIESRGLTATTDFEWANIGKITAYDGLTPVAGFWFRTGSNGSGTIARTPIVVGQRDPDNKTFYDGGTPERSPQDAVNRVGAWLDEVHPRDPYHRLLTIEVLVYCDDPDQIDDNEVAQSIDMLTAGLADAGPFGSITATHTWSAPGAASVSAADVIDALEATGADLLADAITEARAAGLA